VIYVLQIKRYNNSEDLHHQIQNNRELFWPKKHWFQNQNANKTKSFKNNVKFDFGWTNMQIKILVSNALKTVNLI